VTYGFSGPKFNEEFKFRHRNYFLALKLFAAALFLLENVR
jgi:hypothetical protein